MIIFLLLAIHVILSLALILIVLLQTGKGSDLASAFGGGGANAVFGGAGPTSFLNKMTTAVAVLFMVTSISLAYIGTSSSSVMPQQQVEPVSAEEEIGEPEGEIEETGNDAVAADMSAGSTEQQESVPVEENAVAGAEESAGVQDQADETVPDSAGETE